VGRERQQKKLSMKIQILVVNYQLEQLVLLEVQVLQQIILNSLKDYLILVKQHM